MAMAPTLTSLPRELRDTIYGYLLCGEEVQSTQGLKRKYHIDISAVNGQLHDEAEEFLYKNNVFVLVKYVWSGFGYAPHQLRIPVIAQGHASHVRSPKHVPMHLAVEYNNGLPWVTHSTQICGLQSQSYDDNGWFLMVLPSFPDLVDALSWHLDARPGPRIYVDDQGANPLAVGHHVRAGAFAQIQLLRCPFSKNHFDEFSREKLFQGWVKSFEGMSCTVTNDRVRQWTSLGFNTVVVSLKHKLWQSITTAWNMKTHADRLAVEGRLTEARRLYSMVVEHGILGCLHCDRNVQRIRQPAYWAYTEQLGVLVCDAAVNGAYLALRQFDAHDSQRLIEERLNLSDALFPGHWLLNHLGQFHGTGKWNRDLSAYRHMILLTELTMFDREDLKITLTKMRSWFVRARRSPRQKRFWEHDIALFESILAGPETDRTVEIVKDRLKASSACAMPLRVFKSQRPDPALMAEPQVPKMRKLPQKQQEEIRKLQKEKHLPEIEFKWP